MQQLNTLTGIRGLTALWVILFHTYFPESDPQPQADGFIATFASRGWLGVDLFFVLSGFVIAHVYSEKMQAFSWSQTWDFYRRRFVRIYPTHIFVLGLFFAYFVGATVLGVSFNRAHYGWDRLFAQLLMINGIGLPIDNGWNYVSWSISAELAAYLLFPFLAPLISRAPARLAFAAIIVIFALTFGLAIVVNDGHAYFLPWNATLTRVVSEFSIGALAQQIFRNGIPESYAAILAPAIFFLIIMVSGWSKAALTDGYLVMLFAAFIATIATDKRSLIAEFLQSRPMLKLGEISFSVYLIQNLVEILVNFAGRRFSGFGSLLTAGPAVGVLTNTALSIIAGSILYHTIERQTQRLLLAKIN